MLGFSLHRYFDVQRALVSSQFVVAKRSILVLIMLTTASTMRAIQILYSVEQEVDAE